ncbi:TetR/AcrR family transcriptional regulator [Streptomyces alfalfae]|nr:TetR/AcrR family transcriptional regulator [Streptomyces alfalfae]
MQQQPVSGCGEVLGQCSAEPVGRSGDQDGCHVSAFQKRACRCRVAPSRRAVNKCQRKPTPVESGTWIRWLTPAPARSHRSEGRRKEVRVAARRPDSSAAHDRAEPQARSWTRPASRGDRRLEALLSAAETLIAEKPFADISVGELATRAGISRPTFYFYFETKHSLLAALLERVMHDKLEIALRGFTTMDADPAPQRTFAANYAEILALWREHAAVVLAASDAMASDAELRAVYAELLDLFIRPATVWIERERASGRAPAGVDAATLATTLVWMSERNLYAALLGMAPLVTDEERVAALAEVWIRGVFGSPPPPAPAAR